MTCLLLRALRAAGLDAAGMKPICCGDRTDAELIHAASDAVVPLNDINPVWLRAPAAPYAASMIESRVVDLDLIRDRFTALRGRHRSLLVEGVGGWRVPITRDYFVSDLARDCALPVVVVVPNRLGALNHTLLTVESIRATGLEIAGLILNHLDPPSDDPATTTNRAILEDLLPIPILFEIAHGQRRLKISVA